MNSARRAEFTSADSVVRALWHRNPPKPPQPGTTAQEDAMTATPDAIAYAADNRDCLVTNDSCPCSEPEGRPSTGPDPEWMNDINPPY